MKKVHEYRGAGYVDPATAAANTVEWNRIMDKFIKEKRIRDMSERTEVYILEIPNAVGKAMRNYGWALHITPVVSYVHSEDVLAWRVSLDAISLAHHTAEAITVQEGLHKLNTVVIEAAEARYRKYSGMKEATDG